MIKKIGNRKYGLHPVYKSGKRFYAIASYGDVTEIIPVQKEKKLPMAKMKGFGYTYTRGKIKQIRRTGASGLKYAKKVIQGRK